jgi:hypothetical protein
MRLWGIFELPHQLPVFVVYLFIARTQDHQSSQLSQQPAASCRAAKKKEEQARTSKGIENKNKYFQPGCGVMGYCNRPHATATGPQGGRRDSGGELVSYWLLVAIDLACKSRQQTSVQVLPK